MCFWLSTCVCVSRKPVCKIALISPQYYTIGVSVSVKQSHVTSSVNQHALATRLQPCTHSPYPPHLLHQSPSKRSVFPQSRILISNMGQIPSQGRWRESHRSCSWQPGECQAGTEDDNPSCALPISDEAANCSAQESQGRV